MTCSTRKKNFCVEVLEVSELIQGSCSSRPPSERFCAATITTLSDPSNLRRCKKRRKKEQRNHTGAAHVTLDRSRANLLVILPLSLDEMEESSGGASGECESACARLCCSKLYSRSSASNVPTRFHTQTDKWVTLA